MHSVAVSSISTVQLKSIKPFDGIEEIPTPSLNKEYPFWRSVRMTYTICAFIAMVVHLCMRNTINFVILCMVKYDPENNNNNTSVLLEEKQQLSSCYSLDLNDSNTIERVCNHRCKQSV